MDFFDVVGEIVWAKFPLATDFSLTHWLADWLAGGLWFFASCQDF